jgi:hypothetical protein
MIAQRAPFYPQFPPVYPQIHVDFENNDLYCKAKLLRDSFPGEETDEEEDEDVNSSPDSVGPGDLGETERSCR